MLEIKPVYSNVLLEPLKEEEKTQSGIILPDSAKGKKITNLATVIAIGPDVASVEIGNTVIFSDLDFETFEVEEKKYLIGAEDKILALVNLDNEHKE